MIFNNKHYLKWLKDMKALINQNIRAMNRNSISKITLANNWFFKLIIFIFYKIIALIKYILTFNYSKANIGIVKYFIIFITSIIWIFVIYVLYIINMPNLPYILKYFNSICDPLINAINQNTSIDDLLKDFLDNFKYFNEYLDDNFIDSNNIENEGKPTDQILISNKPDSIFNFNNTNKNIPNTNFTPSNIWTEALIGIGLILAVAGIYYGIIYFGNYYFSPDTTVVNPNDSGTREIVVQGLSALDNKVYNDLHGAGLSPRTLNSIIALQISLPEVSFLYNEKEMPIDWILNHYKDGLEFNQILALIPENIQTASSAVVSAVSSSESSPISNLPVVKEAFANLKTINPDLGGSLSGTKIWDNIQTATVQGYDVGPSVAESSTSGLMREQIEKVFDNIETGSSNSSSSSSASSSASSSPQPSSPDTVTPRTAITSRVNSPILPEGINTNSQNEWS